MYKTHTCNDLRVSDVGSSVVLCGWINSIRSHGGVNFIDLRDRYGLTQLVIAPEVFDAEHLSKESTIRIEGSVVKRDIQNSELDTGEIEVKVSSLKILAKASPLPLNENATEDTRLKYRYLDIRRPKVLKILQFRHKLTNAVREYFSNNNFIEFETPLLIKSTPEGARDYVVPSRVNKHMFYALPQSPQLYKQILMIAGVDKYFQIARCLRDEDLRSDRQPEHTQIDFEMSFVDVDDVFNFVEGLFFHMFKKTLGIELDKFEVFTYEEAMTRFGSDKPDIRFGLELNNVTSIVRNSDFDIFKNAEAVNCIVVNKDLTRNQIDELTNVAKIYKAKGLAYAKFVEGKFESGISKFLNDSVSSELISALSPDNNSTILFVADKKRLSQSVLGQVRLALREMFNLVDAKEFKFCWIKDFPLFAFNDDENKWEPEHNMFAMPKAEFVDDFEKRPGEVLGDLYDLAMNGWELGSGAIRVSDPQLQERIMNFIGYPKEEAQAKFGFLLEAYKYGAPVHAGMGLGFDRIVALMLGLSDIREVITFPKNKNAQCPMDGSPNIVTDAQLKELHIKLDKE